MLQDIDCVETFVEHTEDGVKYFYAIFLQQPMAELMDVLKREYEAAEKCCICFKEFNDLEDRKKKEITATTRVYVTVQSTTIAT